MPHHAKNIFLFLTLTLASLAALAAPGGQTICETGSLVASTLGSSGVQSLISVVSYLAGGFLTLLGAGRLAKHSQHPVAMPLSRPLTTLFVASLLLALPSFAQTVGDTIFGAGGGGGIDFGTRADDGGGLAGKIGSADCSSVGAAGGGKDIMAIGAALGKNSVGLAMLAKVWAGLGGLIFLYLAARKLMLVEQRRAEFSDAAWTAIAGGLLLTFATTGGGELFGTISATYGMPATSNFLGANYDGMSNSFSHCESMKGIFVFMRFVGLIAMIRGVFLLKAYGEGKRDALFRAFTHLSGGALLANLPWLATVLVSSGLLPAAVKVVLCV
jgi:hypothetical protein